MFAPRRKFEFEELPNGQYFNLGARCRVTGEMYWVSVKPSEHRAWLDGKLAQDAFASLTVEQREFVISGWTPAEQNIMFGSEE